MKCISRHVKLSAVHPTTSQTPSRLLEATELITELWSTDSAPSLRWLREQQRRRTLPYVKIGRRVFFDPAAVRAALDRFEVKPRGL